LGGIVTYERISMEQDFFMAPSSGYVPTENFRNSPTGLHLRDWVPEGQGLGQDVGFGEELPAGASIPASACPAGQSGGWLTDELVARGGNYSAELAAQGTRTNTTKPGGQRVYCFTPESMQVHQQRILTSGINQQPIHAYTAEGSPMVKVLLIVGSIVAVGVGGAFIFKKVRSR
jgi:hypothetical protein